MGFEERMIGEPEALRTLEIPMDQFEVGKAVGWMGRRQTEQSCLTIGRTPRRLLDFEGMMQSGERGLRGFGDTVLQLVHVSEMVSGRKGWTRRQNWVTQMDL